MALNPKYILASDLQSLFRDKADGSPLAYGQVTFYRDLDHNDLKPVFQLTGNANSPVYSELPNPMRLSSIGTMQDNNGNDIIPYYYPFNNDGEIDLYYITVQDQNGVEQFTREAFPNYTGEDIAEMDEVNFIPNGQFIAHNEPYNTSTVNNVDVSTIAQGGWTMEVTNGLGGVYTSTFTRIGAGGAIYRDFPRYKLTFTCSSYALEGRRDICCKWNDVNQFEAAPVGVNLGEQTYTLLLHGRASNSTVLEVRVIKYFGTNADGSPTNVTEDNLVTTITLSSSSDYFNVPIQFGSNLGKIVGDNNDDYVQIVLRPPANTFSVDLTDFGLFIGTVALNHYPPKTNAQMLSEAIAGWMPTPNPDGSDLYLPLLLTQEGMRFDAGDVGTIYGKTQTVANPNANELLMNGMAYVASERSPLGIPYSRLASYLIANSPAMAVGTGTIPAANIPLFGTGANFVTIWDDATPGDFLLEMNTASGSNAVNVATSGFSVSSADPVHTFTVPSVPSASTYFSFTPNTGGALVYNVWFSVDGAGSAPAAPTGANIEVELVSADTVATTIAKIQTAIHAYQFMLIDARGYFWRGLDTGTSVDPDSASRSIPGVTNNGTAETGALLGSLQDDQFESHTHTITAPRGQNYSTPLDQNILTNDIQSGTVTSISAAAAGGNESRPKNLALNWFIKY